MYFTFRELELIRKEWGARSDREQICHHIDKSKEYWTAAAAAKVDNDDD